MCAGDGKEEGGKGFVCGVPVPVLVLVCVCVCFFIGQGEFDQFMTGCLQLKVNSWIYVIVHVVMCVIWTHYGF